MINYYFYVHDKLLYVVNMQIAKTIYSGQLTVALILTTEVLFSIILWLKQKKFTVYLEL